MRRSSAKSRGRGKSHYEEKKERNKGAERDILKLAMIFRVLKKTAEFIRWDENIGNMGVNKYLRLCVDCFGATSQQKP